MPGAASKAHLSFAGDWQQAAQPSFSPQVVVFFTPAGELVTATRCARAWELRAVVLPERPRASEGRSWRCCEDAAACAVSEHAVQ